MTTHRTSPAGHPRNRRTADPFPHWTAREETRRGAERAERGGYLAGDEHDAFRAGFLARLDVARGRRVLYGLRPIRDDGTLDTDAAHACAWCGSRHPVGAYRGERHGDILAAVARNVETAAGTACALDEPVHVAVTRESTTHGAGGVVFTSTRENASHYSGAPRSMLATVHPDRTADVHATAAPLVAFLRDVLAACGVTLRP